MRYFNIDIKGESFHPFLFLCCIYVHEAIFSFIFNILKFWPQFNFHGTCKLLKYIIFCSLSYSVRFSPLLSMLKYLKDIEGGTLLYMLLSGYI